MRLQECSVRQRQLSPAACGNLNQVLVLILSVHKAHARNTCYGNSEIEDVAVALCKRCEIFCLLPLGHVENPETAIKSPTSPDIVKECVVTVTGT